MPQFDTQVKIGRATTPQASTETLIAPMTPGRRPLILQGQPAQTADLLGGMTSTGGYIFQVTCDGYLRVGSQMSGIGPSIPFSICAPFTDQYGAGQVHVMTNDPQAADKGSSITLGGARNNLGTFASGFARLSGYKSNSVELDLAGYFSIWVRQTQTGGSGNLHEKIRIPSTGGLEIRDVNTVYLSIDGTGNIVTTTGTGSKIGTSNLQKIGFWNATPVIQSTGWAVTAGYTADKSFNPESTTLTELARVVGTLVDALKLAGLVGA
jgi:hypothetical protein